MELIKLLFRFQGSCRVLTHLSKKTAKLNRSAVSPEKPKAVLPVIPVDEADRRRALYTGTVLLFYLMMKAPGFYDPARLLKSSFRMIFEFDFTFVTELSN